MHRSIYVALAFGLLVTVAGCGDDKKSDCEKACDKAEAARCVNADPASVCVAECKANLADPTCPAEAKALVACVANTATFSCDEVGFPQINGCDAEFLAYANCLE